MDARDFEERRDARIDAPVAPLESIDDLESGDYDFRRLQVDGLWDPDRLFLIKHRVFDGEPGYWIVSPLHIDDGDQKAALLVNRGWIHRHEGPEKAAQILDDTDDEPTSLTGLVHVLDEVIVDDDALQRLDNEPNPTGVVVLNSYDTTSMHRAIDIDTLSRPMVLTKSPDPDGDQREPIASHHHITEPYLTAETHFGYMLTWYFLAIALVGLWIAYGFGVLHSRSYDNPARSDR